MHIQMSMQNTHSKFPSTVLMSPDMRCMAQFCPSTNASKSSKTPKSRSIPLRCLCTSRQITWR